MSKFRPVRGIKTAEISAIPPTFIRTQRSTGKKKKGRDYERKAVRHFQDLYPGLFVPHPWIHFIDAWGDRWVQPDGLLVEPLNGTITIVEFKLKHTPQAWYQLKELYEPLVQWMFPADLWTTRTMEVVRWYDGATWFPGACNLRPRLTECRPNEVGVLIWCP